MAVSGGNSTYRGYSIMFWLTPKMIRATIWQPTSSNLVKGIIRKDYVSLRKSVLEYLDGIGDCPFKD